MKSLKALAFTLTLSLLATTLAFILLGTSAFGAEIKMTCDIHGTGQYKMLFKYQDRLLMKDLAMADLRVSG